MTATGCGPTALHGPKLQQIKGGKVSLSELTGKVTVVNLFSTWCQPCKFEMQALDRLQGNLKERGLQVVGVLIDDTLEHGVSYLSENEIHFPILLDREGIVRKEFDVVLLPKAVVTACDGRYRKVLGKDSGEESFEWNSPEAYQLLDGLLSGQSCPS